MDEETKLLLKQIADELRERNEMIRKQQEAAEQMRSEMMNKFLGTGFGDGRQNAMKALEDSRSQMTELRATADEERTQRQEFQAAILAEMRRLNGNLESFLKTRG